MLRRVCDFCGHASGGGTCTRLSAHFITEGKKNGCAHPGNQYLLVEWVHANALPVLHCIL